MPFSTVFQLYRGAQCTYIAPCKSLYGYRFMSSNPLNHEVDWYFDIIANVQPRLACTDGQQSIVFVDTPPNLFLARSHTTTPFDVSRKDAF